MLCGEPPFVDDDPMGIYQKILSKKLSFPRNYDKNAKSLTKKLLAHDLTKRYGCLKGGAKDIRDSKFFNCIDWHKLLQRKLDSPIIPEISGETDTSNFDFYPDSSEEAGTPMFENNDPFEFF